MQVKTKCCTSQLSCQSFDISFATHRDTLAPPTICRPSSFQFVWRENSCKWGGHHSREQTLVVQITHISSFCPLSWQHNSSSKIGEKGCLVKKRKKIFGSFLQVDHINELSDAQTDRGRKLLLLFLKLSFPLKQMGRRRMRGDQEIKRLIYRDTLTQSEIRDKERIH